MQTEGQVFSTTLAVVATVLSRLRQCHFKLCSIPKYTGIQLSKQDHKNCHIAYRFAKA